MSDVTKLSAMFILSLCMTLTACGGGGGGSDSGSGGGDVVDGGDTGGDDGGNDGGDGGDGGTDEEPVDENAPEVTVTSPAMKQLMFSWDAHEGDDHYVLSENRTGSSGFTQVGEDISGATETTMDVSVHHYDGADATFMVEVCPADGECVASAHVGAREALIDAIGYFKASNTDSIDEFGQAVALSEDGTTLVVGAHDERSGDPEDQANNEVFSAGAVYVFVKTDEGWEQQAYIKARDGQISDGDDFGHSVALSADGSTLAVGAPWEEHANEAGAYDTGAVYVYVRTDGTWSEQGYLHAENLRTRQHFGVSLSLSDDGNTLAVGGDGQPASSSEQDDGTVVTDPGVAGSVHIFSRSEAGAWDEVQELPAAEPGDLFGFDVALSGDASTLAVGATHESSAATGVGGDAADNSAAQAGAVYVFGVVDGTWTEQAYLKSSTTDPEDWFGSSVVMSDSGDLLAVGAVGEDDQAGAVHLFARTADTWAHQGRLTASNPRASSRFGTDVALAADGSLLAVGAINEDSPSQGVGGDEAIGNGGANSGAVYVFSSGDSGWGQTAYVKAPNTQPQALFGQSVAFDATGALLAVGAIGEDGKSTGVGGDQSTMFTEEEVRAADGNPTESGAGAVYLY